MRPIVTALCLALLACAPSAEAPSSASIAPTAPAAGSPAAPEVDASLRATAEVGSPAPDFTLSDLDGNPHTLASLKGKTVVLEWFNPGCPYVVAAYESGPMRALVTEFQQRGVVWLAVNSGAPGKQGHGVEVNKKAVADWSMTHPVLLDEAGTVGRAYGAKTTPHLYVINPEGVLVYAGALDNAPRGEVPASGYVGFTRDALSAALAGEPIKASKTQAWGCSVKYGS